MIKDIFILGSTGSIGLSTLKVLKKEKKNFKIKILTTNKNVKKILNQAINFNVKNVVIFDESKFHKYEKNFIKNKIKVFFFIRRCIKKK